MMEIRHFINGEYVPSGCGRMYDDVNPANGAWIGKVHEGSQEEIDRAVKAARDALGGEWGRMPVEQRMELLHRVADRINDRFEEFLVAECLDTGKPWSMARQIDIPRGAANFKTFAELVKNVPTESFHMDTPDATGALNYAIRKPKGVIAVISPWNLPLLLMTWKVGPALACGNTVVVKPSEETPQTTSMVGEVMNEAGIPPGVFNVVNGFGPNSAGEFLTRHKGVDGITFTGEVATGVQIMKTAADRIRDVSFELGGKNPALVFADADLDAAIEGTTRSAFANCGQVCFGTERIYVERPIFEEFVTRLKEAAESLKMGWFEDDTVNFGPLISREHRNKVLGYYQLAAEEGATVVTGGGVPDMPEGLQAGAWIQPTIWTDLPDESRVIREEIFGPCCHIRPFDSEKEVIGLANDTEYGLAATVWTRDLSRAHRVVRQLEVGLKWVNCWFLRDLRTAFGGSKMSGIGREGGVHGMEFYSELSNVCIKV